MNSNKNSTNNSSHESGNYFLQKRFFPDSAHEISLLTPFLGLRVTALGSNTDLRRWIFPREHVSTNSRYSDDSARKNVALAGTLAWMLGEVKKT